jgi:hypothetical protein
MIAPSVGLFIFFILCVGVAANSPSFQEQSGPSAVLPFWEASFKHYQTFFSTLFQLPSVCWSGNAVNEFQKHQCDDFWQSLMKSGGLGVSPLILVGLIGWMSLENISGLYRRAQKKVEKGKVAFGGVVTNPPDAPTDLFSWFYCFRPVTVQLTNKTQITVYVSLDSPPPLPGETLAVFEMGRIFGEKRHVAMLYAPHVVVVRGA